ncbi:MAG: calcium/sodium antiporter [Prevotella sp.]
MLIDVLLIIVGVAVVLWGADRLTEGSVSIASKIGVSQMVIGLTVVALGTSMPEFCVSFVSALKGTADMAVGNVVGSNVFNAMLIVGVAAMVAPMCVMRQTVRKDLVFAVAASVVMGALVFDNEISRADAVILASLFLLFMWITIKGAKRDNPVADTTGTGADDHGDSCCPVSSVGRGVVWIVLGLAALVGGSNVFVDSASSLAIAFNVPDAVVGLTIVAGGTSMPELATSVVAARKGNSGIAIGNVIGSNVFNILFVVGLTGIVCPMTVSGITWIDLAVMIGSMLLLWLFAYTKLTIARWEGAVLTVLFVAYLSWLIVQSA